MSVQVITVDSVLIYYSKELGLSNYNSWEVGSPFGSTLFLLI